MMEKCKGAEACMAGFQQAVLADWLEKLRTISNGDHRAQGLRRVLTVGDAERMAALVCSRVSAQVF